MKHRKPSRPYNETLKKFYKDPNRAVDYLNAALEDGDIEVFLVALKDVAQIHGGGLAKLARDAKLNRANLYRSFSITGRPEIQTLEAVLEQLNMRLAVVSLKKAA